MSPTYLPPIAIPVPVPVPVIVAVVVVIVPTVSHRTPIWHSHIKWAQYTKGDYRVARNPNRMAAALAASNRSNNIAHQVRLAAIRCASHRF